MDVADHDPGRVGSLLGRATGCTCLYSDASMFQPLSTNALHTKAVFPVSFSSMGLTLLQNNLPNLQSSVPMKI